MSAVTNSAKLHVELTHSVYDSIERIFSCLMGAQAIAKNGVDDTGCNLACIEHLLDLANDELYALSEELSV